MTESGQDMQRTESYERFGRRMKRISIHDLEHELSQLFERLTGHGCTVSVSDITYTTVDSHMKLTVGKEIKRPKFDTA